jgi:hypothetical protein
MPDEPIDESEAEKPALIDVTYNRLQLGRTEASLIMNGAIRDEILLALIRIGALTSEQLAATLEKGEKAVEESATDFDLPTQNAIVREIAQQMRDRAKQIREGITERVIQRSSEASE